MIRCVQNDKHYRTAAAAAKELGLKRDDIFRQIYGKIKNAGGYTFHEVDAAPVKRKQQTRPDLRVRVKCVQTGRIFPSLKAAARYCHTSSTTIHQTLVGKIPHTANGFSFVYYEKPPSTLSIAVRCEQTLQVFESHGAAADWLSVPKRQIGRHLEGKPAHINGYTFCLASEPARVPKPMFPTDSPVKIIPPKITPPKPTLKTIRCNESGGTFVNAADAARFFNIDESEIRRVLDGEQDHASHLSFSYVDM